MDLAYPLLPILFYIALLFAPKDVDRISITGPGHSYELTTTELGWKFTGKDHDGLVSIKDDTITLLGGGQRDSLPILEYVASAVGHDWAKQPKVTLQDANTLEKVADGYVLRIDDGKPAMKEYRITFHKRDERAGSIQVNVLGAVANPGVYSIAPGSSVPEALAAAGGLAGGAEQDKARVLRGIPGDPQKVITGLDAPLLDRDTIYVPLRESIDSKPPANQSYASPRPGVETIAIAADGALTVAGKPCPPDELAAMLEKLAANQPVAIRIQADRATPLKRVVVVMDACKAAGIANVKIESADAVNPRPPDAQDTKESATDE